ncbi:sister chromatid cohesion protein 1 [Coemansia guatemalensis]|uniref:Sister chromatid cohesion protein 1 n=1 Tax=Coemansia guatemalensis TaxID=2761395 RepID=A0A9W8LQ97_9FUNG|nr:sister chromatid cohesion protein 1 [Coemansia guatemalensis]
MFYAEAILSKKGPLAKVWLAAHLERKLTKAQLLQASIPSSVGAIIGQDQGPPLALRLSGQLLLGVARIYARKARYLLEDCGEALVRIKMAFRPGAADITSDAVTATQNAITLPEALTEFDILLPSSAQFVAAGDAAGRLADGSMELDLAAASNTSRLQDITLAEQQFDISAVARGAAFGEGAPFGEEDLLGHDDEFRLDLDADFVLSPPPQQLPEPSLNLDGSALEPETGRDAAQGLEESMVGIRTEDVALLGKTAGEAAAGGSMMDITREDLGMEAGGSGILRFGAAQDMASPGGAGDMSMVSNTQEAALQDAEAQVLSARAGTARPGKRRRLNLSELVTNEATSLSPDEIRGRLNNPADIVRLPTYLPATRAARLEDMSSAAVALRFLSADSDSPFAPLFEYSLRDAEQQVPGGPLYNLLEADQADASAVARDAGALSTGLHEPRVPEYGLEEGSFRIEDAEEELNFGAEPDAAAQQLEADVLLADKSIEQLERLEEESFQRQAEEEHQQQRGVRLFTDTTPGHVEGAPADVSRLMGAGTDRDHTTAAIAEVYPNGEPAGVLPAGTGSSSKNTTRAIHILDTASKAEGIQPSEAAAAASSAARGQALSFMKIAKDARRDDAVRLFFELLVLKSKDFIDVSQPAPFEDILVVPRAKLGHAADSIEQAS